MYELQNMLELIEKEGGIKARLNFIEEKCSNATLTLELLDAAPSVEWLIKNKI